MKDLALTQGTGFNRTPATYVQTTVTEKVSTAVKRQLDVRPVEILGQHPVAARREQPQAKNF